MIHSLLPVDIQKKFDFESYISFPEIGFDTIEFDSRDISSIQNTLFVCLKGQKSDGHQYISQLIALGVKSFLISDRSFASQKANFYICNDTLLGFQKIAEHTRKDYKNEVIAITGSNGKTIVKEWLGQLLSTELNVCKSPKSFNSQIGVPYSVSRLKNQDCAIFETGISKAQEMNALEKIIQPTIGIFTNLGDAHNEGFTSLEAKLKEKVSLFRGSKKIIYCSDQDMVNKYISQKFSSEKRVSWGVDGKYKLSYSSKKNNTVISVNKYVFETSLVDNASLENASHCIVASLELGLSFATIQYGLSLLKSVDMRFEIKEGAAGNLILNDSYNNDLAGLKMVLDLAKKLNHSKSMILMASDFLHQDIHNQEWKKERDNLLLSAGLDQIFWVGEINQQPKGIKNISYFSKTEHLLAYLDCTKFVDTFFIIKGARQFKFEQLVLSLETKQHITRVEVNLSRLTQNYNYYKSLLLPKTKIMVMVKAFAYGTGIVEVAKLLEINKVDYLAVAYVDEGVLLRQNGISKPIMVMNVLLEDAEKLEKYTLEPEIYSLEQLRFFVQKTKNLKYHLKLDTGMHRLGFDKNTMPALIDFLNQNKDLEIQSILTHLAASDEVTHDDYTHKQLDTFQRYASEIEKTVGKTSLKHALNSAGIERFTKHQFDMVRLGIGIYGFGVKKPQELKQVICLKTHISQIRNLETHETVGYGRKGKLKKNSVIATIPIGYADGYDRRFSNGIGSVLIHGKEAKVIGNVCMDMTMIDVTDLNCQAGDEVIIYNDELTADVQAKKIGTISYELLTHLSERVRRIFFFE